MKPDASTRWVFLWSGISVFSIKDLIPDPEKDYYEEL